MATATADDGGVKVNVNVGDGENEGSVDTAATGVAEPAAIAAPFVRVATDDDTGEREPPMIGVSVKFAAVLLFGVIEPLLITPV